MKNTYTSEQKQTIIERYISGGETYLQINEDTGIAKSTFYSWLKKYNFEKETAKAATQLAELGKLNMKDFPLLKHIKELLEDEAVINVPWKAFETEYEG